MVIWLILCHVCFTTNKIKFLLIGKEKSKLVNSFDKFLRLVLRKVGGSHGTKSRSSVTPGPYPTHGDGMALDGPDPPPFFPTEVLSSPLTTCVEILTLGGNFPPPPLATG